MTEIRWFDSLAQVGKARWDRLVTEDVGPFMEWEWLLALEESACAAPGRGWTPKHCTVWEDDRMVAAAPMYIKSHSMGEFVFDFGWAQAAENSGIRYYPKLVAGPAFTPSPTYRFIGDSTYFDHILDAARDLVREMGLGGFSILFPTKDFASYLDTSSFARWDHHVFEWRNEGFEDFEDYLGAFNKNQRRNIRREIASVAAEGLRFEWLTGEELTPDLMDLMFDYYKSTNDRFGPWAAFFLNRDFFRRVGRDNSDRVVLLGAYRDGESTPLALAFFLRKGDELIGRYWGASEFVKNLYFVICYYEPIRWAIQNGIRTFDPGMGSTLKVRRGFHSSTVGSYHDFADPRLQEFFSRYIQEINDEEQTVAAELDARIPWKRSP